MLCSNLRRPIDIKAWLSQIPDEVCSGHLQADLNHAIEKSPKKRKRRLLLVSPPASDPTASFSESDEALRADMAEPTFGPPEKRRKQHHRIAPDSPTDQGSSYDPDATPTQGRQILGIYKASLGTRTRTPTASDHESSVSGQSSPTKRLAAVSLGDAPLETKEFATGVQIPPAGPALEMFNEMEYLANNEGLLPAEMRPVFEEYTRQGKVSRIGNAAFDPSGQREALGYTPSVDQVLDILHEAMRCQELVQTEHGWNCGVHFPLLKLAIHGPGGRNKQQLVDFESCTHAKPLAAYRSPLPSWPTHMVDFCINLCPRQAGPDYAHAVEAIDALRTDLTDKSINHTGHNPLLRDPIAISIETKRPDEGNQKQTLQVGVWQTAQWWHLEKLVRIRLTRNPEPPNNFQERCDEILRQLDYLPAIFVRGHEWSFAATRREGRKTVLWREVPMGTTRNVLGIYRIVYAIQLLVRYSKDHFWPWYLREILGISVAGDQ